MPKVGYAASDEWCIDLKLKKHEWPRQLSHYGTWGWRCLKEKRSWTVSAETHSDSCIDGLSL